MNNNISMAKKLKRCTFSSQEIVLDLEDLLTLILLRLPYRKLVSLKLVSKKWQSLITTGLTTGLLRDAFPPLRASALLMQQNPGGQNPDEAYFVSVDHRNTPSVFEPFDSRKILQSCNGLLLCCDSDTTIWSKNNFCVFNFSTKDLETLPEHPLGNEIEGHYFALAYDPLKSLHYKVITFYSQWNSVDNLHIYSSETKTWKASVQSSIRAPGMIVGDGVYWNGCIHWLSHSDCFYFNVDKERFETFPRPPIVVRMGRSLYFGESEGHLHFIDYCLYDTSFVVYEMKSDYSEWFLKYQIDLDSISKVFPEMADHKNHYAVAVLSLVRREKFKEDSFLVLEIPGKVIRYNLVDKSFELIWDFGVTFNINFYDYWTQIPGRFRVCQYRESLSCA